MIVGSMGNKNMDIFWETPPVGDILKHDDFFSLDPIKPECQSKLGEINAN